MQSVRLVVRYRPKRLSPVEGGRSWGHASPMRRAEGDEKRQDLSARLGPQVGWPPVGSFPDLFRSK